jgi:hypothetical protein
MQPSAGVPVCFFFFTAETDKTNFVSPINPIAADSGDMIWRKQLLTPTADKRSSCSWPLIPALRSALSSQQNRPQFNFVAT